MEKKQTKPPHTNKATTKKTAVILHAKMQWCCPKLQLYVAGGSLQLLHSFANVIFMPVS